MIMRMLEAGGMPLLTDGRRVADDDNPHGYFEFEPVKHLEHERDQTWLPRARGKAVKIISFLLTWLPEAYDYRVIFMQRDLDELIASQKRMLLHQGTRMEWDTQDASTRRTYQHHLQQVDRFLVSRRCFTRVSVEHRRVMESPATEARRIAEFLGRPLDIAQMAASVDAKLYRNRR
jgi:hypothetical protein